jgi:hypothetical protein
MVFAFKGLLSHHPQRGVLECFFLRAFRLGTFGLGLVDMVLRPLKGSVGIGLKFLEQFCAD